MNSKFSIIVLTLSFSNFIQSSFGKDYSNQPLFIDGIIACQSDSYFSKDPDRNCLADFRYNNPATELESGQNDKNNALEDNYYKLCSNWRLIKSCAFRFLDKTAKYCQKQLNLSSIYDPPLVTLKNKVTLTLFDGFCSDFKSQALKNFINSAGKDCEVGTVADKFISCLRPFFDVKETTFDDVKEWIQKGEAEKCLFSSISPLCSPDSKKNLRTLYIKYRESFLEDMTSSKGVIFPLHEMAFILGVSKILWRIFSIG